MVVLSACCELVTLRCKVLFLRRTRFFERNGLKVTSRYGLGVVPTYLECTVAHRVGSCRTFQLLKRCKRCRRRRRRRCEYRVGNRADWLQMDAHAEASWRFQKVEISINMRSHTPLSLFTRNLSKTTTTKATQIIAKRLHEVSTSNYSIDKAKQGISGPRLNVHLPVLHWFP